MASTSEKPTGSGLSPGPGPGDDGLTLPTTNDHPRLGPLARVRQGPPPEA
jgi:hypothetical protein